MWIILLIERIDWAEAMSWPATAKPALIVLSTAILAIPTSHWVPRLFPQFLRRWLHTDREVAIWTVILTRLWGTIALGVPSVWIALCVLPPYPNRLGVNLNHAGVSIVVAVISWIVLTTTFWLFLRFWPAFYKGYPEIDIRPWTFGLMALNSASWIVYLIPFEFLFRGFLLFPLASLYGGAVAMLVSTGIYSIFHLVREPQEQLSTIFAGVLFGGLALGTGSILAPILIHWFMAPAVEIFALRARPRPGSD
jgi:membrane protease YdiL (CAAX protease family)